MKNKNCPNCGAPIDIHRRTCPYCDVPYEKDEDKYYFYCDNAPIMYLDSTPIDILKENKLKAEINASIAKQIQEINNGYRNLRSQFT